MTLYPVILYSLLTITLLSNGPVLAQDKNNEESGVLIMAPVSPQAGRLPPVQKGRLETREQLCDKYAKDTVEQLTWLEKNNCSYGNDPFSNSQPIISYDVIYNDCMYEGPLALGQKKFKLSEIPIIIKERRKAIADCICKPYAYDAVQQNDENLKYACGEDDWRWRSDFPYHYDWCARGGGSIINSGSWERFSEYRESVLQMCKKQAPIDLKPNGYPKLEKQPVMYVELTWKDPAQNLLQSAHRYEIDVDINDKTLEKGFETDQKRYKLWFKDLPYSAKVVWRVRSHNQFGPSDWSNASFKIEDKPVPPSSLNITYKWTQLGEPTSSAVFKGKWHDSKGINAKKGKREFDIEKNANRVGDYWVSRTQVKNLRAGRWIVNGCAVMVPGSLKIIHSLDGYSRCESSPPAELPL